MFITDSGMWLTISRFASSLGVQEDYIVRAKRDFYSILDRYTETRELMSSKYNSKELSNSLSMQIFYPWWANFFCFYELVLSGFRHTALRELRFYLESSARSYYIDTKHRGKTYKDRIAILEKVRKIRGFRKLLGDLPKEKQDELVEFYKKLCDYVHLSEVSQTDALGDFGLNLALQHPYYEEDKELLKATFEYSCYLLLESLKEVRAQVT